MKTDRQSVQDWFFEQLAQRLAEVFEVTAGARPEIRSTHAPTPELAGLSWRQPFTGTSDGPAAVWVHASERDWTEAGNQILRAVGMEDADPETVKSTWTETLGQTLSGIAQDFSARLGREITCAPAEESAEQVAAQWMRFRIKFPGEPGAAAEISCAIENALLDSLVTQRAAHAAAAGAGESDSSAATPLSASGSPSKTFDLLLDVELPVSVSFGRAQVQLKDLIKLTTGAIVELNRSISEPVEVIVNNCVIARGEVVVVEGNFGVRIREVISRQERLRTLN